ncbi:MAG: TusE/DsrC/DsvC family sulfur relay protein [Xanthomonadales bacterium]|nr:TusE/DsrC/DsvC family sulfur relay protein [Xanthomonadales bacterium]
MEVDGRVLATDSQGYLVDPDDWEPAVAETMAARDDIELTAAHWEIIHFVRDYYQEFRDAPPMRLLVKAVAKRLGPEKGNSRYLYGLFPEGPAKQVCRYAGLPKPVSCI